MDLAFSGRVMTAAVEGPILLTHWFAPPDAAAMRRLAAVHERWLRRATGKLGSVTVIDATAGHVLPKDARDEAIRMQRASRERVAAIATVVAESGFRAAILRSVLTGIAVVSSLPAEQAVFDAAEPASRWLTTALLARGTPVDERAVLAAVDAMIRARPAPPSNR